MGKTLAGSLLRELRESEGLKRPMFLSRHNLFQWSEHKLRFLEDGRTKMRPEDLAHMVECGLFTKDSEEYLKFQKAIDEDWKPKNEPEVQTVTEPEVVQEPVEEVPESPKVEKPVTETSLAGQTVKTPDKRQTRLILIVSMVIFEIFGMATAMWSGVTLGGFGLPIMIVGTLAFIAEIVRSFRS